VKTLFYGGPGRKIRQDASGPAIVHHADGTDKGILAGDVPALQNGWIPGHEGHVDHGGAGVTELSPTEWRVSDRTIPDGDPSAVLGFIQQVSDTYEVTNLRRLRERSYFSSFERATASFTAWTVLA